MVEIIIPTKLDSSLILEGSINISHISGGIKDASDSIPSLRTLGTGSSQSAPGYISNEPFLCYSLSTSSFLQNAKVISGQGTIDIFNSSSFIVVRNLFGSEYIYSESDSRSTNSTLNWGDKISITGSNLSGTYRVGWSALLDIDESNILEGIKKGSVRLLFINNLGQQTIVKTITFTQPDFDNAFFTESSFKNFVLSGTNIFVIQWRSLDSGHIVGLSSSSLEFCRIC